MIIQPDHHSGNYELNIISSGFLLLGVLVVLKTSLPLANGRKTELQGSGFLAFTCFLMDVAVRELRPERSDCFGGGVDGQKEVGSSQTVRRPGAVFDC